ncbi:MAG: lactate dehydrogenase [Burkholderiales bacterium]|nr:lactate dehydrogenase [Phycisphaerae bacterium]
MKISVIGIGKVGSTVAFVLAKDGLATELVLYNRTREIARADAIDIQQAVAFVPHRVRVRDGAIEDTAGSDVIILCVGVRVTGDSSDRNEWATGNTALMKELVPQLVAMSPSAIIINVTNPLDVITYHVLSISGFPWQRVIGTGTLIDSARFREMLSEQVGIHPIDLNAYILGEHGNSAFAALSIARSGGEPIDATPSRQRMIEEAKQSAWEVFRTKGYTNYAVAMAVQMIVHSIVEDLRYTMPVSVLIEDYCGVSDVCLSVPCVIGRQGVHMRLRPQLSAEEESLFQKSAASVRRVIEHTRPIIVGDAGQ